MNRVFSVDEVTSALAGLPEWSGTVEAIARTVRTDSFRGAIALVNAVADAAESANHHPDIDIRWRDVTFTLSSHSAGGVTSSDFEMAEQIDALVS